MYIHKGYYDEDDMVIQYICHNIIYMYIVKYWKVLNIYMIIIYDVFIHIARLSEKYPEFIKIIKYTGSFWMAVITADLYIGKPFRIFFGLRGMFYIYIQYIILFIYIKYIYLYTS